MKSIIKIIVILVLNCFIKSQNIETEVLKINIFNNKTELITGRDINIKLIQNTHEHNNTNKFVGTIEMTIKSKDERGPAKFADHISNFGKMIGEEKYSFDLRYILNCKFELTDEPLETSVKFQAVSKESTSHHIYGIQLLFPNSIKKETIFAFLQPIEKVCTDTKQIMESFKGEIENMLNENFKLKQKSGLNTITPDQVSDPMTKSEINKMKYEIESAEKEIKNISETKGNNVKRNLELISKMNEEQKQMKILESKNQLKANYSESAGKTLELLNQDINSIIKENSETEEKIKQLNPLVSNCEKTIQDTQDELKKDRDNLNQLTDQNDRLKKQISENDSKNSVLTKNLTGITSKASDMDHKINSVLDEKKEKSSDSDLIGKNIDALQAELKKLEEDKIKFTKAIEDSRKLMDPLQKKESNLYSKINNENMKKTDNEQRGKTAEIENIEKNFLQTKKDLLDVIDPKLGEIISKASNMIVDPSVQDNTSWIRELQRVPDNIYKFKF